MRSCERSSGWWFRGAGCSSGLRPPRPRAVSTSSSPGSTGAWQGASALPRRPGPWCFWRGPGRRSCSPSSSSGVSRPGSPGRRACLPAQRKSKRFRRRRSGFSISSRAALSVSSRRSSRRKTTTFRPTTSRKTRNRWSPTARRRRTWGCGSSRRWRRAIFRGSARSTCSNGSRRRSGRSSDWRSIAVTSTTGTTRAPSRRSSRVTSRPSTAGTSPGT